MKKLFFLCAFCVSVSLVLSPVDVLAQKETFDITTYSPIKGWKKQPAESAIQFTKEDAAKGTYCMITLYKAVPGTANSKENFDLAWASLVKEMVTVFTAPEMQPAATENGWEAQSGYAPFESEGTKGVVMLVTSSSSSKMVNIIILTNTNEYEKEMTAFLESVSLKKSETTIQQIQTPAANNNNTLLIGTWGISVVVPYRSGTEGTAGSNVRQYTFNANGTFSFYIKTFKYNFDKLLLTKETGTYQISGNKITISPQKSVIESWSKKDGTDNWDKLVSTQNKTLEKTTYQFTKHYSAGMQEWNLVLQANNETQRDGPYNGGTAFSNAWLYSIPCNKCLIELPGGQQITTEETKKEPVQQTTTNNNVPILGTWGKTGSVNPAYNDAYATSIAGYSKDQYTFNSNGTYNFVSKTFGMSFAKLLLVKENGAYQISGNNITINPKKSVIEAWSKKDGVDKWGKLLSTQTRKIEKVTYTFTKHYFSGIQIWNLVLQANKATQRDGAFSSNTTFSNAWYYAPISSNNTVIELPGGQQLTTEEIKKEPVQQTASNGFVFTSTNFDDGWISTVKEDWVQVTKANIKVLIHYPNKQADAYNSVVMDGLKNAWNILVAPRYSTASNFEFKPITGWQTIEFAEADMTEKTTGKTVHIVLFKMNYSNGSGKYLEFITADKNSFEQEFGAYHQTTSGWEKMEKMANYNKFAVAASDLTGKWTNDFSGAIQYVNAATGFNAHMATHASVENFKIGPGTSYNWDLGVASGNVGNIKFQGVKSSGKFSISGNWQINFSDIEHKPRTYNAYFSCIKGLRILWLDDRAFAKAE